MITREEFDKANSVVSEYKRQFNESRIKSHKCMCCKTKEIKPLDEYSLSNGGIRPSEQDAGFWSRGTVHKITFGYGSAYDCSSFFVAICDDCIKTLVSDGFALDVKPIRTDEQLNGITR